ncbi:hypothetical protein ACFY73_22070 [Streptomyces albidoflavus]
MNLPARVRQALGEAVHPGKFEQCACALLKSRYPGLSAVEEGHDFGRDADIYFPFDGDTLDARGRLMVTTGDPVANVRNGLRRMQVEGLRVDLVVVACSKPVNGRTRRTLDKLCSDRDLPPPHIYGQEWFVPELVQDAAWRRSLLDIEGRLGALLDEPLTPPLVASPSSLVGRADETQALASAVDASQDVVLVGVPGVGKTRLTGQLGTRAVYLQPSALDHLYDDLLLTKPHAVVVDDAHAHADSVSALRHARRQTGLSFSVVTTTWPDRLERVQEWLPGAMVIEVGLLERHQMNELVESAGVTGYRSRTAVLNQADGRPGWALALCESLAGGEGQDVFSGKAHVAQVERYLREATASRTVLDALACVAALGGASPDTLYALASVVGVAPAELSGMAEDLAHNGLVECRAGVWHLQPALCPALVARWFFTAPVRRPWTTLVTAFPDHGLDLAAAVMAAAAAAPSSRQAREEAERWVRALPAASIWDTGTFAVVAKYANLDVSAAEFATNAALSVLAALHEPERAVGVEAGFLGDAAVNQLVQSARQFLLPEAIAGLLAMAVGDNRRRHSTPLHPLRVLSDLAGVIDPDFGTSLEIRTRLLRTVLAWIRDHCSSDEQWCVAGEALAGIFSVEVSGNWSEPGTHDTYTFARGIDAADNLAGLIGLWEQVVPLLTSDEGFENRAPCPPRALIALLEMALGWVRLGLGVSSQEAVSAEQTQYGVEGGRRILDTLYPLLQRSAGTALRAHRGLANIHDRAREAGYELPVFDVDPDLQSFCEWGNADFISDVETATEQVHSRTMALAGKLVALGPDAGVARFHKLAEQASLVGEDTGRLTAIRTGELMTDPEAWYRAASALECRMLQGVALTQWHTLAPDAIPPSMLQAALEDTRSRPAAISAVLARSVVDRAGETVIASLRAEDVPWLDRLFCREADDVMHRLLVHDDPAVAASAAVSFAVGTAHGPALPETWRAAWRSALEGMLIDRLTSHNRWRAGYVLAYVAEHDADTFERWFDRRLQDMSAQGWYSSPLPHDSEDLLALLPRPHRLRLALQCIGMPRIGPSALVPLINSDAELAKELLDEHAVDPGRLVTCLEEQRNTALEEIGPLLLERGVSAQQIAAAAASYSSWSGDRSRIHLELIDYFTDLADRAPALRTVAAAGCSQQQALLREAEERERDTRVRGW